MITYAVSSNNLWTLQNVHLKHTHIPVFSFLSPPQRARPTARKASPSPLEPLCVPDPSGSSWSDWSPADTNELNVSLTQKLNARTT